MDRGRVNVARAVRQAPYRASLLRNRSRCARLWSIRSTGKRLIRWMQAMRDHPSRIGGPQCRWMEPLAEPARSAVAQLLGQADRPVRTRPAAALRARNSKLRLNCNGRFFFLGCVGFAQRASASSPAVAFGLSNHRPIASIDRYMDGLSPQRPSATRPIRASIPTGLGSEGSRTLRAGSDAWAAICFVRVWRLGVQCGESRDHRPVPSIQFSIFGHWSRQRGPSA